MRAPADLDFEFAGMAAKEGEPGRITMSPKSKRKSWRLPLMFLLLLLFNGCLTAGIRYWVIVGRMPENFTATPEFRALMISPENFAEVCERAEGRQRPSEKS